MSDSPFEGVPSPAGVDYGSFAFSVKQFVVLSLTESVSHAVPSGKPTQPILGCVRITVGPESLEVAAANPDQAAFASTTAVVAGSQHVFFADAKRLLAILREAPQGDLEVSVKKNLATVSAGGGVSWTLKLPDPGGYHKLPDLAGAGYHAYDRQKLLTALRAVRHAICKDASQPSLTQVAIATAGEDANSILYGKTYVTASDRSRLARAGLEGFPAPMTIPAGVLDDLQRLLSGHPADTIDIAQTESALVFRVGSVTITASKRTFSFPDMDKQLLAPTLKENTSGLTVDRAELVRAVRRVAINADAQTSAIALRLDTGTVTVEARDKAGNSAQEPVLATWEGSPRVVVVNHGYLLDMLTAHPSPSCEFLLGPDHGKKLSPLLLSGTGDENHFGSSVVQVLTRMPAALLGY